MSVESDNPLIDQTLAADGWKWAVEPFWPHPEHRNVGDDRTVVHARREVESSQEVSGYFWKHGLHELPQLCDAAEYEVRHFKCRNSMNDWIWWENDLRDVPGAH